MEDFNINFHIDSLAAPRLRPTHMTQVAVAQGVIHWRFARRFDVEPLVTELAAFAPGDWQ